MGRLTETDHVFAYGSLVADLATGVQASLGGWRRVWGVATDNLRSIPGYKQYLSRVDGTRPAVYVAFLDIEADPSGAVDGLARPVGAAELVELDRRERNYDRVEVTGEIEGVEGRVWTYRGSRAGRERLRRGRAEGRAVVSRDYLEKVRAGFDALGSGRREAFERSCLPDAPAVMDLDRVDLPPAERA